MLLKCSLWTIPTPNVNPTPDIKTVILPILSRVFTIILIARRRNFHDRTDILPVEQLFTTSHQQLLINQLCTASQHYRNDLRSRPELLQCRNTEHHLAFLFVSIKKKCQSEAKQAQYNGHAIQLHKWYDQFEKTIDSASLPDDVHLRRL